MPIQQQLIYGWTGQNGVNPISETVLIEGDGEDNRSIVCEADVTLVSMSWGDGKLKSIFMVADRDITLLTNDPDTPQDTIHLTADYPFQWDHRSGLSEQFEGAVTAFYFEKPNPTEGDVAVTIKTVIDATP